MPYQPQISQMCLAFLNVEFHATLPASRIRLIDVIHPTKRCEDFPWLTCQLQHPRSAGERSLSESTCWIPANLGACSHWVLTSHINRLSWGQFPSTLHTELPGKCKGEFKEYWLEACVNTAESCAGSRVTLGRPRSGKCSSKARITFPKVLPALPTLLQPNK